MPMGRAAKKTSIATPQSLWAHQIARRAWAVLSTSGSVDHAVQRQSMRSLT